MARSRPDLCAGARGSEGQGPCPPTMVRMTSGTGDVVGVNRAYVYSLTWEFPERTSRRCHSPLPDFPWVNLCPPPRLIAVGESLYGSSLQNCTDALLLSRREPLVYKNVLQFSVSFCGLIRCKFFILNL